MIASAVAGRFQKLVNKIVNSLESLASDPVIKQMSLLSLFGVIEEAVKQEEMGFLRMISYW